MKILMLNSSSHRSGCTDTALREAAEVFRSAGMETDIVWLGTEPIRDCIGCSACNNTGRCVFQDDIINKILDKASSADAFIFGSPVYYAHPTGRLLCCLDRLFRAGSKEFAGKPGAAIVSARRAGTTASLDVIYKHLSINQMPVISSTYWAMVHGSCSEDVKKDLEGLQTVRNLAQNMIWWLQAEKAAEDAGVTRPTLEKSARTNFIR